MPEETKGTYNPEKYWNKVAVEITNRNDTNVIAGDDEPYYRYKRQKFLSVLNKLPFQNKKILEIGSGPGGNLIAIKSLGPMEITGVDISAEMVKVATELTKGLDIKIFKTDGKNLPFQDKDFDISITSTVLQHVTEEAMVNELIQNMQGYCY